MYDLHPSLGRLHPSLTEIQWYNTLMYQSDRNKWQVYNLFLHNTVTYSLPQKGEDHSPSKVSFEDSSAWIPALGFQLLGLCSQNTCFVLSYSYQIGAAINRWGYTCKNHTVSASLHLLTSLMFLLTLGAHVQ